MPKYLIEGRYSAEGTKGVAREGGSARRSAIEKTLAGLGGKLESLYFAFGDTDIFAIADFPSNEAAVAFSLAANQTGAVSGRMTVLLTPEEMDRAAKMSTVEYRPPGR